MKRSFLTSLGLEKEIIDQIMKEYGIAVEALKARTKETEDELRGQLQTALAQNTPEQDEFKAKYEAELAAHESTRNEYTAEKEETETLALLRKALAAEGANPNAVDLLLKGIELAAIQKKDGEIENWEELCAPVKTKYAAFFGEVTRQGANVGSPPAYSDMQNPFAKEFSDLQAQTNLFRADPRRARLMAAAAGFKLLD